MKTERKYFRTGWWD